MKKRMIIELTAAVLTVLLLVPMTGCIRAKHIVLESRWDGDFCYSVYDDGTAEIIAYTGSDEILKLPKQFEGRNIIGFGMKTFENCENLREVYIPYTVTSLPSKLFCGCEKLEKIFIPNAVKSIGKNVVYECPAFTTVLFGGTVAGWEAIDIGQIPWTDNYALISAEILYNREWD